jgi:hypothetical protein
MIDYRAFCNSLNDAVPPAGITPEIASLWWVHNGDWERAHLTVQDLHSVAAARLHAYLHRLEGDQDNAAYWYRRAAEPVCTLTVAEEWAVLARTLLHDPV